MNSLIKTRSVIILLNRACYLRTISTTRKLTEEGRSILQKSVYLVDETSNNDETQTISNVNKYTMRTVTCGELTTNNLGQRVTLIGWLEFNRMDKFIVLRDSYGETQLLIRDDANHIREKFTNINYESVLQVKGTVIARPSEMINNKHATGKIEVNVEEIQVLSKANILPFNIREHQKANEALQMRYRYLAMRFADMQRNLRFRSEFCINLRQYLAKECGFVEVETPTLFKATPGGAQEFVVPTRHKDRFYSLVQSPQQFKQMLMCGGIDRYFQIARCYRDETSRPDRQPEFTQLDIEMANTTVDGVIELVQDTLQYAWPSILQPIPRSFPRISFKDAIECYGCDKPDIRYEHKIINSTGLLNSSLNLYGEGDSFYAGCLVFDNGRHGVKLGKELSAAKDYPNTRLLQVKCDGFESFSKGVGKILKDEVVVRELYKQLDVKEKGFVFLVYGNRNNSLKRLGKIRELAAGDLQKQGISIYKPGMHFLWIVDFPLFSMDNDGVLSAEHHPFTSPHLDDLHLLERDPLKVRSLSYDLVLNGYEVGGGSIRIHDPKLQSSILNMLNISGLDHIVEMLSFGCPPHGGVALGLDRLFAKILETQSIRDVIAFPKTFDGKDLLSGAPSAITEACRKIYHL